MRPVSTSFRCRCCDELLAGLEGLWYAIFSLFKHVCSPPPLLSLSLSLLYTHTHTHTYNKYDSQTRDQKMRSFLFFNTFLFQSTILNFYGVGATSSITKAPFLKHISSIFLTAALSAIQIRLLGVSQAFCIQLFLPFF